MTTKSTLTPAQQQEADAFRFAKKHAAPNLSMLAIARIAEKILAVLREEAK